MVCGPTHIHPAQRIARLCASSILVLQSLLPAREAAARPTHPGKWTLENQVSSFRGTAVNLVLLPGGSTTYHSRVMWWEHDGHGGRVPAGIYTYRLTAGDRQMRRQLVVFP